MMNEQLPVLEGKGITVRFGDGCDYCSGHKELNKGRCPRCKSIWAVRDVSFQLYPGEILGIVGESGSGKSTLLRTLYFDQQSVSGEVNSSLFGQGRENLLSVSSRQKHRLRNELMGIVYQNPIMGLRMRLSAGTNVAEKLIAGGARNAGAMMERVQELLQQVEIPQERFRDAPRVFSGGMQQRVQISKAVANNPPILLLDEVTTGLDLSVQARVLDLIRSIQRELGIAMMIVSHDLAVIRMMSDRCMVMLGGRVVEEGLTDQILEDPLHEYTQTLVSSLL
jgi:putative phosphonate transport system ATP-binding protein